MCPIGYSDAFSKESAQCCLNLYGENETYLYLGIHYCCRKWHQHYNWTHLIEVEWNASNSCLGVIYCYENATYLRWLDPLKLKFSNFLFFFMLFVYSYRLQKAKFKVGEQALFLR